MKKLYSDLDNDYFLLEFRISAHSPMVIRGIKESVEDKATYNIDVFFKPVRKMLLPTKFEGLEVYVLDSSEVPENLVFEHGFSNEKGGHVFLLSTRNGKKYYVDAAIMAVYYNRLDVYETQYEMFEYNLGDRVLTFKEGVLEEYLDRVLDI